MDSNGFTESRYNAILTILQSIAKREGIKEPTIEIIKGCEKGDGYSGEKHLAILRDNQNTLEVFIKAAPTNEALNKATGLRMIYIHEIYFYTKIIPTFMEFQREKNIPKPFTSILECLGNSEEMGNEMLILENAKRLGLELWDRKKQMNEAHVEFVYTEYGKYHGLSYALEDQKPEVYKKLIDELPLNALEFMFNVMQDGFTKIAEDAKQIFDPIKEADVYNAYSAFADNLLKYTNEMSQKGVKYPVIIHGDCWSNNMMFKYETDSNKACPDSMRLIDFQLIGHKSPIMDLSYFLYASAPMEIYDNLDHYLHVYHDSLTKTILDLGSSIEVIPSMEELKNEWKIYSKFGLLMSLLVLKVCIQEEDETMEISDALEKHGDLTAGFRKQSKNDHVYHERLRSLVIHMFQNNFI